MINKLKFFLLVTLVLINYSCTEVKSKKEVKEIKKPTENEVVILEVKDSLISLKGMRLKRDSSNNYKAVKASIKKNRLNLNINEVSKDS